MRVLVIGDIHLPFAHPGYLSFCRDIRDKYRCDRVVFVGDVIDHHNVSFHTRLPSVCGGEDERERSLAAIEPWKESFPVATVTPGNHDHRPVRVAESVNISSAYLRKFREVWNTPRWDWVQEAVIDDVHISHGDGCSGKFPAMQQCQALLMSCVIGHIHTAGGVNWVAGPRKRLFGMSTGCGIDEQSMAFHYGIHHKRKAIIGCGVLIDGIPYHEICPIGPGEKYNRLRFGDSSCKPKSTFAAKSGNSRSRRSGATTGGRTRKTRRSR